jgi:hypothetical protein
VEAEKVNRAYGFFKQWQEIPPGGDKTAARHQIRQGAKDAGVHQEFQKLLNHPPLSFCLNVPTGGGGEQS